MTVYALVPFLASMINFFVAATVYAQRPRTALQRTYIFLAVPLILWPLLDTLSWASPPDVWKSIITRLIPLAWTIVGFALVTFAYGLLKRKRDFIWWGLAVAVLLSWVIQLTTGGVASGYVDVYWGVRPQRGAMFMPVVLVTVILPFLWSIFLLLFRYNRSDVEPVVRYMLLVGIVIPLVGGISTDIIIPAVFGENEVVELSSSVGVLMGLIVYWAMVRHRFLRLGVEEAAMEVFESASDGLLLIERARGTIIANPAAVRLLEMPKARCSIGDLAPFMRDCLSSAKAWGTGHQEILCTVGGREMTFGVLRTPVYRKGIEIGYALAMRDLTEIAREKAHRERLEEQLRHAQKMEAVGTLAGGIAHDMNNVLSAILGFASMIQVELPEGHPLQADVSEVLVAGLRGRDLTRNLLGFARKGGFRRKKIVMGAMFREVQRILQRTAPKNIVLDFDATEARRPVEGDPSQMSQMIMNLCLNAIHAMPAGGRLRVRAHDVEAHGEEGEPFVEMTVKDQGFGMSPEVAARAFEPFFTTKKQGEGTGLGLSMVYGTVQAYGGSVELKSELERGTTVTLMLPAALNPVYKDNRSSLPAEPVSYVPRGMVLIVDDEPQVRRTTTRMLERLGYEVLQAENGRIGVELFAADPDQVRFVILDMAMPEMDGPTCFERLREIDEKVHVIIASGYARGDDIQRLLNDGASAFLSKPFQMAQLVEVINSVEIDKAAVAAKEKKSPCVIV